MAPVFIDIPTEQTTAATDAVLAAFALCMVFYLRRFDGLDSTKARIWRWVFGFLAFSAALGTVVHGFKMSPVTKDLLWQPLYLALGLMVSLLPIGAVYDLRGRDTARKAVIVMTVLAAGFFVLTRTVPGGFLVFVVYNAAIMVFVIGVYGWLAFRGRLPGAALMVSGFVLSILAGVVQSRKDILVTLIWTFDHNGVYHIIQLAGLIVLILGLRAELLSRRSA